MKQQQHACPQTLRPRIVRSLITSAIALAFVPALLAQPSAPSLDTLRKNFLNPPNDARPMVRWWWFGPAVVKPEILSELQQMKADGIQGAELAFVYPEVLDDPAKGLKNFPFLSPEMLDAVDYAQAEGRKLGLRIDLTLCSGWPYGGRATTLAEAAGRIRLLEIPIPPNATSVPQPKLADGESLISSFIANDSPKHWDPASARSMGPEFQFSASGTHRVALFFIAS